MPFSLPAKKRSLGGSSAPSAPGATGAPGAPSAAPGQSSPGYVGFSRLLAVNQGGAQKMADRLAGQAQQKGQQASNQIQQAKSGFEGKVQAGTLTYQNPDTTHARKPGESFSAADYRTAGAMQTQAQRGYEGPKDWAAAGYDTNAMSTSAREAQEAAKALTTAGGRAAALRAQAGSQYTTGMGTIDAALSGAALGSRGRDLASLYGGLSQQLIDAQGAGGKAVQSATDASNAAAKQYAEQAARYQALGDNEKAEEERARQYQEEYYRRYPHLRPGSGATPMDPRIAPLIPGLYV